MAKLRNWLILFCITLSFSATHAQEKTTSRFNVIALYENGGHHILYSARAKVWLDQLAADSGFAIDYIRNTNTINDTFLSRYQLFIQLDYPPYAWTAKAVTAFERYITEGRGGWIGFHHASLLGELTVTQCGNGSRFLWAISFIKITSQLFHQRW